jgi:uncharacterized protein (DUF885 family)
MVKSAFAVSVICLALGSAFTAQAHEQAPAAAPVAKAQDPAKALAALADHYYDSLARFDPIAATINGDNRFDDMMTLNHVPSIRARQFAMLEGVRQDLMKIDRSKLSEADRTTFDILVFDVQTLLGFEPFKDHLIPMNHMDSVPVLLANLASGQGSQPIGTVEQYKAYQKRLSQLPQWTDAAIANMRAGMRQGVVIPKSLVVSLLPQIQALAAATPDKSDFGAALKNFPASIAKTDQDRLANGIRTEIANKTLPAMRRLATFLEREYLPAARATSGWNSLPQGQAWYRAWIRYQTGTAMSPEEIHQIGLKEMERITAEMAKVGPKLGYTGDPVGLARWMQAQPQFKPYKTEQEVIDAYKALNAAIMPKMPTMFGSMPKAPLEIRPEPELSKATASDHYTAPAGDGTRPGIFWAVINDPRDYWSTRMVSLFLHEGAPGHHFQLAKQVEMSIPNFRRYLINNAYAEGWGLYSETLGHELGLYDKDLNAYAGFLKQDMIRAARLVVDTGLHAKGWSREETIKFLMEKAGDSEAQAKNATERYMAWPAQALGYKIGALKIMGLRHRAEKALGPKFSLSKFHDKVLEEGPLPLSLLEQKVDAWIKAQ